MMDRQYGKIVFECDDCGDVLNTHESDLEAANERRRAEGWRATSVDGVWLHYCKEC